MESKEIVIVDPKEYGLNEEQGKEVESNFLPVITERENLQSKYDAIVKKEISKETIQEARSLRLDLVKVRTNTDRIHKVAKAFYLAGGRFVDAFKNKNVTVISQMEEKLLSIENYYVNIEKEKLEKLKDYRIELIKPYIDIDLINRDTLGNMEQSIFDNYLTGLKATHEAKIEAERKAEQERLKKIEEEKAEQERIRIENEKLKAEAIERERLAEIERKKNEKMLAEQKAKAEKEKRILEEKAKAEAIERERIEKELREKQEAEKKRLQEIALKEKQEAEAKAKAERQPDKKKIIELANTILNIPLPEVKSKEAKKIILDTKELLQKVNISLLNNSNKL